MQGGEEAQSTTAATDVKASVGATADAPQALLCIEQALHIVVPNSTNGNGTLPAPFPADNPTSSGGSQQGQHWQTPATAGNATPSGGSHEKRQQLSSATDEEHASEGGQPRLVSISYRWGHATGSTPAVPLSEAGSAMWQYSSPVPSPEEAQDASHDMLHLKVPDTHFCIKPVSHCQALLSGCVESVLHIYDQGWHTI